MLMLKKIMVALAALGVMGAAGAAQPGAGASIDVQPASPTKARMLEAAALKTDPSHGFCAKIVAGDVRGRQRLADMEAGCQATLDAMGLELEPADAGKSQSGNSSHQAQPPSQSKETAPDAPKLKNPPKTEERI